MPGRRQSAPEHTIGQSSLRPPNHAAQTNCRLSSLSLNCNYVFCHTLLFCQRQCMNKSHELNLLIMTIDYAEIYLTFYSYDLDPNQWTILIWNHRDYYVETFVLKKLNWYAMKIAEILREKNAFLFDKYDRNHVCVCRCTRLIERCSGNKHVLIMKR